MADTDLVPLAPAIQTPADPVAGVLICARHEIQRNPALRQLFQRAEREGWDAEYAARVIANGLEDKIHVDFSDLREAARYLFDEYRQLGPGMLVLLPTGRALYKVTEDDLWQPPEVVREDGRTIVPSPRLRPELHGFLVQWIFEEARDAQVLAETQASLPTTNFLAETGDPRLQLVTRAGRKTIVEEIRDRLPSLLTGGWIGTEGLFLGHFHVRRDDPAEDPVVTSNTDLRPLIQSVAMARIRVGLQDVKSFNLQFDHKRMILHQIVSQWIAEIARSLTLAAHQRGGRHILFRDFTPTDIHYGACIVSPEEYRAIRDTSLRRNMHLFLPVPGARSTSLSGLVGILAMCPDGYELRAREVHDRWEILAKCEYTLWLNWNYIDPFVLEELPIVPPHTEVVR